MRRFVIVDARLEADAMALFTLQADDGETRVGVLSAGELWSLVRTGPGTVNGKLVKEETRG